MKFALIAAIVVSAVMAYFAVENSQQTQVTFLGWYFDAPLVIILLLSSSPLLPAPSQLFLPPCPAPSENPWKFQNLKPK